MNTQQRKALIVLIDAMIIEMFSDVYGTPKKDIRKKAEDVFHSLFEDDQEKSLKLIDEVLSASKQKGDV